MMRDVLLAKGLQFFVIKSHARIPMNIITIREKVDIATWPFFINKSNNAIIIMVMLTRMILPTVSFFPGLYFNARLETTIENLSNSRVTFTLVIKVDGEIKKITEATAPAMGITTTSVEYTVQ